MILNEKTIKLLTKIPLTEGAETRNMKAAKHYLYEKMGYNEQEAMQCIGSIKTDIPNSRLAKCKFMLAMVRMYCNGDFDDGEIIMDVNKSLKVAASDSHVNEYNQDLNGLSAKQFVDKFAVSVQHDLEQDKQNVASQKYDNQNSQYQIVKINSFEESEEYGEYVDWCVTHDENMFDSYTNNGTGVFYFCLRNGFEDVPDEQGENCPLDSYGLSMIAVSINNDGSCNTITCRWNHANGGNDHIMTPKQLSQTIDRNFYEVFKPLTQEEIRSNMTNKLWEIQEEIEADMSYSGDIDDIAEEMPCDEYYNDKDPRSVYRFKTEKGDWVLLNSEGEFVIEMIFNDINERSGDIITVQSGGKYNFVTLDGKLLSNVWYDNVSDNFQRGYSLVYKHKKWNILDKTGNIILPEWYDAINPTIGNMLIDDKGDKTGFVEIQKGTNINFFDLTNYKIVFQKDVNYIFKVNDGNVFLRFIGDNFMQDYDGKTLKLKAPFKVEKLLGYRSGTVNGKYVTFYCVQLLGGQKCLIDNQANLYEDDFGNEEHKLIQKNPFILQNENRKNTIDSIINEVRYINAGSRDGNYYNKALPHRANYKDIFNQEPLRNDEVIRVYHGCDLQTGLTAAIKGLSGKQWIPRTYSYESGMNPIGLFVTTDFDKAKDFSTDNKAQVILEFSAKVSDLDTPVWNNSSSYFGQGSNPQPFRNGKERQKQKQKYYDDIANDNKNYYFDYVKKSDNTALANNIFQNNEHQALFYGDLNPNMIKRFWVREKNPQKGYVSLDDKFVPYKRRDFIKRFGNTEFYTDQYGNYKSKIKKDMYMLFNPNDNFTSVEDMGNRFVKRLMNKPHYQKMDPQAKKQTLDKEKKYWMQTIESLIQQKDVQTLLSVMWPKQLKQALGEKDFEDNYDNLMQLHGRN